MAVSEQQDHKATMAVLEQLVLRDHKAIMVVLEQQDHKATMAVLEQLVRPEVLEQQDHKAIMVVLEQQEQQDHKVKRAMSLVLQEIQVLRVQRELHLERVQPDLLDQQEI